MGYWWEGSALTAIPPTSASDVVGQHNKMGGITFGAALIYNIVNAYATKILLFFNILFY